jgi:three-Cys-motif partner protein
MTKRNVKTNLLNHSEAKVGLLGEYLKRYISIITNDRYTKRIHIYDLFCGEGLYENDGEGSPLVILKAINEIHSTSTTRLNNVAIDCYFNDIDSRKVEKVEQVIKEKSLHSQGIGSLQFSSIDYKEMIKQLSGSLSKLANQKAFIFIDPYEYKHIEASQIKELMTHKNTEVLLWLPTQFMYRFESNGTPEALKDFIEELVPYKEWKESDDIWKFITQLKEGFQAYMGNNFYVDTFTIQKDASTVFGLYFFSSHIRGFEKMLETKWDIDTENGEGWCYTGQHDLFATQLNENILEEKLKSFMKNTKRSNGELYEYTLRQGFLPKHTSEIFRNWQSNHILEVAAPTGEKVKKGAFYISYENYKDNYNKVSFKTL